MKGVRTNDLKAYRSVFKDITPWSGFVPQGCIADFVGTIVDLKFRPLEALRPGFDPQRFGGGIRCTTVPDLSKARSSVEAEDWFEAVNWVVSAREARDRYVMITLGGHYGAQAVGACRALKMLNPIPYKLVAVEPVPENVAWMEQHMRVNGIDPDEQWIVPTAISDKVEPILFPVGGPGVGSNNCYSTNQLAARHHYAEVFVVSGRSEEALRRLLMDNTMRIVKNLVAGADFPAEIEFVSSITLKEILAPFQMVDYLEADIQQSEILVFPPFVDLLAKKVRRIHIGTHGLEVHRALHDLFARSDWDIVFSYEPNTRHESDLGSFEVNDGVLTVRNPEL